MAKSRYDITSILKNKSKEYLTNTIFPKIDQRINDTYIIANEGHRLDDLANKHYGDSKLYWVICLANDILDGDIYPEIGKQICIPNPDRLPDIFFQIKRLNENG